MTDVNAINNAVNAANSTTSTSSTSKTGTTTTTPNGTIGKDDFLKLLVGQLQHQDPMQPADDSQFIGQMAQFSQLEQETNTAQSTGQIATQLGHSTALGLIGHAVTYTGDDHADHTGNVQQVDVASDGSATLTVDGVTGISIGNVTQVR
jgi:flagellar basal-body rod modification protein FlgD